MIFGSSYSKYYNLFYTDKDYHSEVKYVAGLLKQYAPDATTLLDVGCGTGKHASLLSRQGYTADGMDLSNEMLKEAKANFTQMNFYQGDARNFDLGKKYDVITSLFHVTSYLTSNDDMKNYLISIKKHLVDNGLFVFDFWYGPAVLAENPVVRVKRLEDEKIRVTRIAEPEMHFNENIIDVNYEILIEDKISVGIEKVKEQHNIRYFFMPEINLFFETCGFEMLGSFEWMGQQQPNPKNWYTCVVARKKQ